MFVICWTLFVIGSILFFAFYFAEDSAIVLWSGLSVILIITGLVFITIEPKQSISQFCEEYSICYELVETVAENTKYSKEDVAKFFVIVSDDVEAWDAIKMLDSSLTDEQINAIMEISAMKQVE